MALDPFFLIDQIITNAMSVANQKQAAADGYAQQAIQYASGVGLSAPPTLGYQTHVVEPAVYIPTDAVGVNQGLYLATYNQVLNLLTTQFAGYFTQYFPLTDNSDLTAAETWMKNALTVGGTGLPAFVEAQIWDRDRTRLVREGVRLQDETTNAWAARRYPLPPGALTYQILSIQQDTYEKIAAQSRDISIKQIELQLENIKYAIEHILSYRIGAIQAAGDYIKTLVAAPQEAAKLAIAAIDAQSRLIGAASQYYNARIAVESLKFQVAKVDTDYKMAGQQLDIPSFTTRAGHMSQAAMAAAQSAGYIAAAALNALHSQANVSDITNT